MKEFDNTNRFTLFPNDKREKDTHPNTKGTINVDGVEYWLSGWTKETKDGVKFISGTVQPKEDKPSKPNKGSTATDEDLPFAPIYKKLTLAN